MVVVHQEQEPGWVVVLHQEQEQELELELPSLVLGLFLAPVLE